MEREEFKVLAKGMKAVYTDPKFIPDGDAFDVWFSMLNDLDYQTASVAVRKYMTTKSFPPTIADIREECASIFCPLQMNAAQAWELVLNTLELVKTHGCASKQFAKLPEIVQKSVGGRAQFLEWANNPGFNKASAKSEFSRSYADEVKRDRELAKLQPDIRKLIEQKSALGILEANTNNMIEENKI